MEYFVQNIEEMNLLLKDFLQDEWENKVDEYLRKHRVSKNERKNYFKVLDNDTYLKYLDDDMFIKNPINGYIMYQLIEIDSNLDIDYPVEDLDVLQKVLDDHNYKVRLSMFNNNGVFTII